MKSIKLLAVSGVAGVVMAGAMVSPAFAWHPVAKITKYVQNQTTGGQMADANDAGNPDVVFAKPGDTLKYTIVVENVGEADARGYNDLTGTVMTDELPDGVALASDTAKRAITENLGTLKPGQKVTKEYVVKVTSTKDHDVIKNEACVDGDSAINDNKQHKCDKAFVKVNVPPKTEQPPKETPKPQPQILSAATTTLPSTGAGNFLLPAGIAGGLGYVGNLLRLKRRANQR